MNLRIRDNFLFWFHRAFAAAGWISAPTLEEIRRQGFERVLVVATTAIGDAVLCAPLLDSLRAACPRARIGFWAPSAALSLFEGRSGLDTALAYHGKYRAVRQTLDALRRERYDLALVANANDPDVIPMIWWSGCRRIIRRPQRNTIYSFMIANPEMLSPAHTSGHAIERNLQFCDLLELPRGDVRTRLEVRLDAKKAVRARLEGCPVPWWILHPGASRSRKQWGAANYAAVAAEILRSQPGVLLLTGRADERDACDQIQAAIGNDSRIRNLAGELRLDELAALFQDARLFISGDTGPYHIAMAVDAATVTLFAPWDEGSSSRINGPYFDQHRHRVVETSRMGDPISSITVDRVLEECRPFLAVSP